MRAVYETKKCPLDSDFGKAMAARYFTPEQLAGVEGKAWLVWTKCTKGGWKHEGSDGAGMGNYSGRVMRPGTSDVRIEKGGVAIIASRGRIDRAVA